MVDLNKQRVSDFVRPERRTPKIRTNGTTQTDKRDMTDHMWARESSPCKRSRAFFGVLLDDLLSLHAYVGQSAQLRLPPLRSLHASLSLDYS
jgi:hypothetical protein